MNAKATIYDVAEAAGVSASTVSRVFSRPDRVSSATSAKVRAVAEELGYRSTLDTRPKTASKTHLLGAVVADLSNPVFQEMVKGAEHAAKIEDYVVICAETGGSVPRVQKVTDRMIPAVDALLLASTRLSNGEIQKIARQLPTVSLNRPVQGVPSVLVDNYAGAINVLSHLFEQGATSVTYLSGPDGSWADAVRWRGMRDLVGQSEQDVNEEIPTRHPRLDARQRNAMSRMELYQLRFATEPTISDGRTMFNEWAKKPTDAVVCFNSLAAIGFLDQAHREGVDIPGDVLVAAFDDSETSRLVRPSLTTVTGPSRTVGRVAAANALALARGLKSPLVRPRVLPTRLIVRGSTMHNGVH